MRISEGSFFMGLHLFAFSAAPVVYCPFEYGHFLRGLPCRCPHRLRLEICPAPPLRFYGVLFVGITLEKSLPAGGKKPLFYWLFACGVSWFFRSSIVAVFVRFPAVKMKARAALRVQ